MIVLFCCGGILFAQSYRIGDLYTAPDGSQGVVYYVFPDGSGGWAVELNDASVGCIWGNESDVPGLINQDPIFMHALLPDTAGYANTQAMRVHYNNSNYAAGVVDFVNGWVLPSAAQLSMLFGQLPYISAAIINAGGTSLAEDLYWCSAENSSTSAYVVSFAWGWLANTPKTTPHRVRAVRSFTNSFEPVLNYFWSTGDNTPDITISPEQTTTYSVTVSTSNGCSDTVSQTIVVYATNNTDTTVSVCGSYEWNGQVYTESGDYTIVTPGEGGCNNVVTLHLTVSVKPNVTVTFTDDTICVGDGVTLEALVLNSDALVTPPIAPSVAVGDILCTDGTIVKPSAYATSGKTAMGIVFYVDNTGEHGWAVHLHDQSSNIQWGGYGIDIPTLTNYINTVDAITDMDGYSNTQKIRAAGNATTYPAAYAVDFENGWYLPAAGQLNILFADIITINTSLSIAGGTIFSLNDIYWYMSSTEHGSTEMWYGGGGEGVGYHYKGYDRMRSVRSY